MNYLHPHLNRRQALLGLGAASVALATSAQALDAPASPGLKDLAAAKGMRFGTAIGAKGGITDANVRAILLRECNLIVPENELKMYVTHNNNATDYNFAPGDALLDFAQSNHIAMRGHNLFWARDEFTPAWLKNYDFGATPKAAAEKLLRGEWGFKGITVSDYFALHEMITRHHLVTDDTEAAFRALNAGVDVETPDRAAYPHLTDLIAAGRVSEDQINAVVRRILEVKFLGGLFERPYIDAKKADSLTATPEAVALAHEAATRTPVLLKNNGILPFNTKKIGKLLVLGTHAKDTPIGGYSDVPRHVVSILDAVTAEGKAQGFSVDYSEAVRLTEGHVWGQDQINFTPDSVNDKLIADAVAAAKSADTILMVLGDNEQTSREGWADNHLGDRDSLDLIGRQNDLAAQIFALGKPTVVFLLNGRPLSVNLLDEKADALVEGWYMGQETGWAAADILFGRANPGGKLPVSIARDVGQLPIYYNYKPSARRGYIDGSTKPLYPFGYGLSYTTFDISAPMLEKASIGTADSVNVSIDVTNTGSVKGDEVVQLYIRDDVSSVTRPLLELKHFKRVTLNPGEKQTVTFAVTPADLWFFNVDMQRVVEPGTFTLFAGPNSVDLKSVVLTVA